MKKSLYLFLALLLPALIFVFLKYAGKNEFDIPIYFDKSIADSLKGCGYTYALPYHLPDSIGGKTAGNAEANLFIFSETGYEREKLKTDLDDEIGAGTFPWNVVSDWTNHNHTLDQWRCIFLLRGPWQIVLVDAQGRIRGYYDPRLREELDRLRVELKIILKKY